VEELDLLIAAALPSRRGKPTCAEDCGSLDGA
jgi:hypothetical protein